MLEPSTRGVLVTAGPAIDNIIIAGMSIIDECRLSWFLFAPASGDEHRRIIELHSTIAFLLAVIGMCLKRIADIFLIFDTSKAHKQSLLLSLQQQ